MIEIRQWLPLFGPGLTRLDSCRSHARHIIGMLWSIEQRATRSVESGLSLPGRGAKGPKSQNCTTRRTAIPAALCYPRCWLEVPLCC